MKTDTWWTFAREPGQARANASIRSICQFNSDSIHFHRSQQNYVWICNSNAANNLEKKNWIIFILFVVVGFFSSCLSWTRSYRCLPRYWFENQWWFRSKGIYGMHLLFKGNSLLVLVSNTNDIFGFVIAYVRHCTRPLGWLTVGWDWFGLDWH